MICIYNYVSFINFCKANNTEIINFNKNGSRENSLILHIFLNFLKKCYKDKKLLNSYESMKPEMYNIEKKGDNLFLLNTLRMISYY